MQILYFLLPRTFDGILLFLGLVISGAGFCFNNFLMMLMGIPMFLIGALLWAVQKAIILFEEILERG